MQLKYLNFHKILSQLASNMVGAFIALIIFQKTGSLGYGFLFVICEMCLRIFFNFVFRKLYYKYPQIILLLRVFPMLIYSLCIFLLDVNLILGVVLVGIFFAMQVSFKELPMEIVLNYSYDSNASSSGIGLTRFFEQLGCIASIIIGGLFLDYLPSWIVITISMVLYIISIIPLIIYYIKERKNPTFNRESISNAIQTFKDVKIKNIQEKRAKRKLLFSYCVTYGLLSSVDTIMTIFSLFMFSATAGVGYSMAGYIQAVYFGVFGIGSLIAGKLNDKYDLTVFISVISILNGICVCILPFLVTQPGLSMILFGILGLCYSFMSTFLYVRVMPRARIMGISNEMLYIRTVGYQVGQTVPVIFSAFGLMFTSFFVMAGMHASSSFAIPFNEEKNRRRLVDYLQNNRMY